MLEAAAGDGAERIGAGASEPTRYGGPAAPQYSSPVLSPSGLRLEGLVEDPWRVLACDPDPAGCQVAFADEEFATSGRDALYYVRAIEEPSLAVDVDPLGCTRDESGRCVAINPCFDRPADDDCLAETEERAWSSPIFVNQAGGGPS